MSNANQSIHYELVETGRRKNEEAEIIVETPVSLMVNGELWLTFMCTPVALEAMAVGFLYNENVIQSMDDVADVRLCATGENVDVWLHSAAEQPDKWRKTSGCTGGVTSVVMDIDSSIQHDLNGTILMPEQVSKLIADLFDTQDLYRRSGGVHTSALSDGSKILASAEDIGRHNTLDKIAGRCLIEKIESSKKILLTTGRISSEMMQKASRIGATIVISRTSPSSLSIQFAERLGITLIGYARRTSFRIYTHPQRISEKTKETYVKKTQNPHTGRSTDQVSG